MDRKLKLASVELGLNPALMKDAFASIRPVTDGLIGGDLEGQARRNLNIMKKAMAKYKAKNIPKFKNYWFE